MRAARLRSLAGAVSNAPVCFAVGAEASLLPGGVARLDATWPDEAAAARLAHLHAHGAPPSPGPGCLELAVAQEAAAWQIELSLRQELGALQGPGSPPFAEAWVLAPRPETVVDWLYAQPAGAAQVPASLDRLRARCQAAPLP